MLLGMALWEPLLSKIWRKARRACFSPSAKELEDEAAAEPFQQRYMRANRA